MTSRFSGDKRVQLSLPLRAARAHQFRFFKVPDGRARVCGGVSLGRIPLAEQPGCLPPPLRFTRTVLTDARRCPSSLPRAALY